jgi:hypothetical protein
LVEKEKKKDSLKPSNTKNSGMKKLKPARTKTDLFAHEVIANPKTSSQNILEQTPLNDDDLFAIVTNNIQGQNKQNALKLLNLKSPLSNLNKNTKPPLNPLYYNQSKIKQILQDEIALNKKIKEKKEQHNEVKASSLSRTASGLSRNAFPSASAIFSKSLGLSNLVPNKSPQEQHKSFQQMQLQKSSSESVNPQLQTTAPSLELSSSSPSAKFKNISKFKYVPLYKDNSDSDSDSDSEDEGKRRVGLLGNSKRVNSQQKRLQRLERLHEMQEMHAKMKEDIFIQETAQTARATVGKREGFDLFHTSPNQKTPKGFESFANRFKKKLDIRPMTTLGFAKNKESITQQTRLNLKNIRKWKADQIISKCKNYETFIKLQNRFPLFSML